MSKVSKYSGYNLYDPEGGVEGQVNQKIVSYWLELDDTGNFVHKLKEDNDLDEFIQLAYGIRLPRKVITPGHRSSFEFVADLFFERVKAALAFANRTGGKTLSVALLNHLDLIFKRRCEITSAGAVVQQAEKCYEYFKAFNTLPFFKVHCENFALKTGSRFDLPSTKEETKFGNLSKIEIITASQKGFRGPHPQKSRVDEIDEIPWNILQTGLSMSQSAHDIRGQDVFTSTRQNEHGSMQRLLDESQQKGIEIYEWNIWESLEKCNRRCINDPVYGTCPVLVFCNGQAHDCDGFYSIDDFVSKATMIDRDTWDIEWVNKKPAREKLVYKHFNKNVHVLDEAGLLKLTGCSRPSLTWGPRISSLDFGASPGNPFVYLKLCGLPGGIGWLVYFEYYVEQRLLRDHARAIKASPGYTFGERIYGDWDAQDRLELKQYGVNVVPAVKGPDTVSVGIDKISEMLQGYAPNFKPVLYVWHECVATIKEFALYQWPIKADGTPDRSGRPKDGWDHAMDALRYAIFSHYRFGHAKYRARKASGV